MDHEIFVFPLQGVYDTSPKMVRLYTDSENRLTSDGLKEFVYDKERHRYLEKKLHNLIHNPCRYRANLPSVLSDYFIVSQEIYKIFAAKCPEECSLDGHRVQFFNSGVSLDLKDGSINVVKKPPPACTDAIVAYLHQSPMPMRIFDAFALHIQEDFAVSARDTTKPFPNDYLELAHIMFPSHWDPRQKIGKNFREIHQPVANNARLLKAHQALVGAMFERGPFSRFVWGIAFSSDLDRHPDYINENNEVAPYERKSVIDQAYLRIERQVTYPLLNINRSLFTIRIFMKPIAILAQNPEHRLLLKNSLISMNEEALEYKGLLHQRDHLVSFLSMN
jgi:hypothetical protein